MFSPDRLDKKILSIVQQNNQTPHREIAGAVGLSTPAVTRRLQKLRSRGLIVADTSVLDSTLLGRPLTIIVQVQADSEQIAELDAMRELFRDCRQIQHCYYVTGEADFLLVFNVADMAEYELLTRELFFSTGNVRHFTSLVAMDTIKSANHVVLD